MRAALCALISHSTTVLPGLTVLHDLCSVTKKMTQKYGEFTQDPAFQSVKWWQKLPGMK